MNYVKYKNKIIFKVLGHDKKNDNKTSSDDSSDEDEDVIKNAITSRGKFATFLYMRNSIIDPSKPLKTDRIRTKAITSTPTPIIEIREIKVIKLALNGEKKYLFATNKETLILINQFRQPLD